MPVENVGPLVARLYDPDGAFNRVLSPRALSYLDRNSDSGSGSFTMDLLDTDIGQIVPLSMVKFHLKGAERFGVRVGAESARYGEVGGALTYECLGLFGAILSDAIVLDESGSIRDKTTGQRWVGWMAAGFDDAGFTDTLGDDVFAFSDVGSWSTERLIGIAPDWPDQSAWWLNNGGSGAQLWRREFDTAEDMVLKLWATADEQITVWFDGELVLFEDSDETGYTKSNPTELGIVFAGTHHLAVEVRVKATPIIGDGFDGFALTLGYLDATGAYAGNVTRSDDSADWVSWSGAWGNPRPGMTRLAAMRMLWNEAAGRDVLGTNLATLDFTDTVDSGGATVTDVINEAVNIGDQTLDQVFLTLCEGVMDLGFDAAAMKVQAWARRGADVSATKALKRGVPGVVELADGANITELGTSRNVQVVTDLWARLQDGNYITQSDSAAVAAYGGRIERAVQLGNTPTGQGQVELTRLLAQLVAPEVTLNLKQALHGAQPYDDYVIGDSVTAPAHIAGTARARVTSITVSQAEGQDWAEAYPGLMPDPA